MVLKGLPELVRVASASRDLPPDEAVRDMGASACGVEELLGCSSWTVLGTLWWAGCAGRCPRVGERTCLSAANPASLDCVRLATESPKGLA